MLKLLDSAYITLLKWLGIIILLVFTMFKVRKGGIDAQKLKNEQKTNEKIITTQKRINDAGNLSDADVLDSLRKGDF